MDLEPEFCQVLGNLRRMAEACRCKTIINSML